MQYKIIPTTIILKIFKKMEFERLAIQDLVLLKPKIFSDDRGHFFESYNQKEFDKIVGSKINFVQDNCSLSKRGVFRGIHLQRYPYSQGKLVRVAQGKVIDFAIDLRKDSKTYLMWEKVELSDENSHMLWIPEGFGHAFLTISEFSSHSADFEGSAFKTSPKILKDKNNFFVSFEYFINLNSFSSILEAYR